MKAKIIFSLVLINLVICKVYAQTTLEEYNYLTKGYKIQIESGLDVKKGYTIEDLGSYGLKSGNESRNCSFKGLYKQGQSYPSAILMIYKRTDIPDGTQYYICIPSPDASDEVWNLTLKFLNEISNDPNNFNLYKTMLWALMKFSSSLSKG